MIKSFSEIKNLAVFKDFKWDREVRDGERRPIHFAPLNIIYGRNYSGKTTLSRIVRALETGTVPDKLVNPQFTVALQDGALVNQSSLSNHGLTIRVFNEDFVRENLRVFIHEQEGITAFAVLGEGNALLADQLAKKETELGAEHVPGSLLACEAECQRERDTASSAHERSQDDLDELLRDEARRIKEDSRYSDVNYDIRKIKADIPTVRADTYVPLSPEQIAAADSVLKETTKDTIEALPHLNPLLTSLESRARTLLSRAVQPSQPIQELLNDAVLQEWVRDGRGLHQGIRTTCAFCGNPLSDELWFKLDKHFSEESETLRSELETLLSDIESESSNISDHPSIDTTAFYSAHKAEAEANKNRIESSLATYQKSLAILKATVENRLQSIFEPCALQDIENVSESLCSLVDEFEALRNKNNAYTDSLSVEQNNAREALRLNQVMRYLQTITFDEKQAAIKSCAQTLQEKETQLRNASQAVSNARATIADLKSQMRDERNGAEKVNEYLSHYFGHPSLSLAAVAEEEEGNARYRFEVRRDGVRAFQLSEGERRLLAFCYFMARLGDVETSGTKPIIWIDDPISSLDDNHVFFIYSLVRSQILERGQYGQLFISTHSLNFLKYLRRVTGTEKVNRTYFLVERCPDRSVIRLMPKHLRTFATEFHYLFHRIYRCAHADEADDGAADAFYSFGNDLRKFLEIYLYFRYPDGDEEGSMARLRRFLGDDPVAATVTDRVENEYSHLNALFERGFVPVDVPAMKSMAQLVLHRIKAHDVEQYAALLSSVGEPTEVAPVAAAAPVQTIAETPATGDSPLRPAAQQKPALQPESSPERPLT